MLKRLRRNFTVIFVFTSVLIYAIVLPVGIIVFAHGLNSSVDANLNRLLSEIQPSVTYTRNAPTLAPWADSAAKQHIDILSTVQLFDNDKKLLEDYGPPGVPHLLEGGLRADLRGRHKSIRSKWVPLHPSGFLQVQVGTQQVDEAIGQFMLTMLLMSPIMLAASAACGWMFAVAAVKPVARSMYVLRRFVADAAHELKTPTTIIQAATQTLQVSAADNKEIHDIIDVLTRASQRLRKLADDLVLLARMESPELKLNMQIFSLDELVSQVTEDFAELAKNKSVTLTLTKLTPAKVYGNADSLSRVLINLIDNAIRYTEAGGRIDVSLDGEEASWLIAVQDTGIGIPPGALRHVFDRFYRVDESRARAVGGSGLGLSIAHAIVEAHGGSISVSSEEGKGSKFVVTIPCNVLPSRQATEPEEASKTVPIIK